MDMLDEKQPKKNIELEGMAAVDIQLRMRIAKLQAFADKFGVELAQSFNFVVSYEAAEALETYDRDWFDNSVYSPKIKFMIAEALCTACRRWVYLDLSTWQSIIKDTSK